jgi:hypothetical protein
MKERISQVVFITGRILHQGTGRPIIGQVNITAREGPLQFTLLDDGRFGLSGDLRLLLPKPSAGFYVFNLTLQIISRQFRQGEVVLPISQSVSNVLDFAPDPPALPAPPVDMGTILVPADPVNLRGQVVEARNPGTPVPGATVAVTSVLGTTSLTTPASGEFQFNNLAVQAPAQITCSKPLSFKPAARVLLLDYRLPVNEERFQLLPV